MEIDRIEKLLALILIGQTKSSSMLEKISQLNVAGFNNVEIADLLQTTSAVVSQSLYVKRKAKNNKKASSGRK